MPKYYNQRMKQAIKREIIAWKIFRGNNTIYDIAIVLFKTTNGELRATIGLWDSFDKRSALDIANTGERLLFEEAYPFFKHLPEMRKENYHPA
jgi:hypothetical protein